MFRCAVCQESLQEETRLLVCTFCGASEEGEWCCPNNHYTCETCRLAEDRELIERVCQGTKINDPVVLANVLMSHPVFHAHGPEHHLIIAPVVLTVLGNAGIFAFDKTRLGSIMKRTSDIPIGACSSRGDCGACVGVGALFSVLGRALHYPGDLRSLTLRATAQTLLRLSTMPGHRCCKQSIYAALETTAVLLKESLHVSFPVFPGSITCAFAARIEDCKKQGCPFYPHV